LGIEAGKASWHDDYKDSPYIYVGGLSYRLNEGDIKVAFSQWGTINHLNLIRDKKTGKTKGFAFIGYEDQRSTTLAVDNMNGVQIDGRQITVDHKREYKPPKESDSEEDSNDNDDDENKKSRKRKRSPKEEEELDPKKLKKLKKKEKKKQKKHAKREEKRKEIMRLAFSQNTSITVEDLEFKRKLEKKNSQKSINELREEELSNKKQDNDIDRRREDPVRRREDIDRRKDKTEKRRSGDQ